MSQLTNKSMLRQDTYQCKDIINTYFIMIVTNFIYFLNIITVLTLNSTFSLQMYFYVKKKTPLKEMYGHPVTGFSCYLVAYVCNLKDIVYCVCKFKTSRENL